MDIDVACDGEPDNGWTCRVILRVGGHQVSAHDVRVGAADLPRLARPSLDPSALVEASFVFLLERESPESILRSFDLLEIARYFPDYEATIRKRIRAP